MPKKRPYQIAISDDDGILLKHYYRALELEGYEVQIYVSVDELKPLLSLKHAHRIDMFIIDIMQPSGESYSSTSTDYGMYTGLFLARDARKAYPSVPIILFSFASFPDLRESASRLASKLSNCIFLPKGETMPSDLIDIVNRYFEEFELRPKRRRSILSRLFSSLLLQPNLSGIGVDLKKLSEDE